MGLAMSALICVTPDTVDAVVPDLPKVVRLALGLGARLRRGTLDVTLPDGRILRLGGIEAGPSAAMTLYNYGFASRLLNSGDIGIAEAYLQGEWDTPDLTQFLYLWCVNHDLMQQMLGDNPMMRYAADRPPLVQPQHKAAGAQQHLRALRHRQRILFGAGSIPA